MINLNAATCMAAGENRKVALKRTEGKPAVGLPVGEKQACAKPLRNQKAAMERSRKICGRIEKHLWDGFHPRVAGTVVESLLKSVQDGRLDWGGWSESDACIVVENAGIADQALSSCLCEFLLSLARRLAAPGHR